MPGNVTQDDYNKMMNQSIEQPLIIDVEASGLGRGSYPIEVGVALPNGDCYCTIIRPDADWQHWDESAEQLHGISRQILQEHGRPITEVAKVLNEWIDGRVVYSDGWGNDSSWLGLLFEYAGVPQRFKLDSLRTIMTEAQAEIWHEVKEQVVIDCQFRRHRASNDAQILQQTYCRTHQLTASQAS